MSPLLPPRPEPPIAPELEDCCQSGCDPCIFDRYHEALERYERELAEYEALVAASRAATPEA